MAAAVALRQRGAEIDLVEIDPDWRSYGAGISLGSATLRAFETLGILDEFLRRGYGADGAELFTSAGHPIASLPTPRLARPDVPGAGAIMRPVLASILAEATRASGAGVRLGMTFERIAQTDGGVEVAFSDGSTESYDLAIGADGLNSKTRAAIFPEAPSPRYTGQCVWRAVLPRPPEVTRALMWLGPKVKAGVNPVSQDEMYLFVTEDRPVERSHRPRAFPSDARRADRPVHGADHPKRKGVAERELQHRLSAARSAAAAPSLVEGARRADRRRGARDDAASGVGRLHRHRGCDRARRGTRARRRDQQRACKRSKTRRWERCRMVVENSVRLGEIEITGGDPAEHGRIMRESMMALAAPV